MKISKTAYQSLLKLPTPPPEIGGILGGTAASIEHIIIDTPESSAEGRYVPNVKFLNHRIRAWNNRGIFFFGIFHTHAQNWKGLSQADMKYITSIMLSMPPAAQKLYFPVVHPMLSVENYLAERVENKVYIIHDDIEII